VIDSSNPSFNKLKRGKKNGQKTDTSPVLLNAAKNTKSAKKEKKKPEDRSVGSWFGFGASADFDDTSDDDFGASDSHLSSRHTGIVSSLATSAAVFSIFSMRTSNGIFWTKKHKKMHFLAHLDQKQRFLAKNIPFDVRIEKIEVSSISVLDSGNNLTRFFYNRTQNDKKIQTNP